MRTEGRKTRGFYLVPVAVRRSCRTPRRPGTYTELGVSTHEGRTVVGEELGVYANRAMKVLYTLWPPPDVVQHMIRPAYSKRVREEGCDGMTREVVR
jgi:hypothetical protein